MKEWHSKLWIPEPNLINYLNRLTKDGLVLPEYIKIVCNSREGIVAHCDYYSVFYYNDKEVA